MTSQCFCTFILASSCTNELLYLYVPILWTVFTTTQSFVYNLFNVRFRLYSSYKWIDFGNFLIWKFHIVKYKSASTVLYCTCSVTLYSVVRFIMGGGVQLHFCTRRPGFWSNLHYTQIIQKCTKSCFPVWKFLIAVC